jgi:hypothetical protein
MRLRRRGGAALAVILAAALIALMTGLSGVAAADGTVVLGGGAGIVVNGSTYCTLGRSDTTGRVNWSVSPPRVAEIPAPRSPPRAAV